MSEEEKEIMKVYQESGMSIDQIITSLSQLLAAAKSAQEKVNL